MGKSQVIIPISQAGSACSSGAAAGGCASASSCSSASSCGSAAVNANDPSFRLQQEGWVLRTTIGEPRLSEVAENYRAMGHEVHVEYFEVPQAGNSNGSEGSGCTTCFEAPGDSGGQQVWGSIYVRPGKPGARKDEELY